ncbi:hypothetical protein [Candidatus Methylacidithermus pantelleriae]|uniref:hypothetical protein n=1 Tax=Candidatus Methylacidithermus pantelleriae TaxID=2744239 RepID=UPI00157C3BA9|nr:hypothetical protein [Candidatus Methylacidithermus pantelleriae]
MDGISCSPISPRRKLPPARSSLILSDLPTFESGYRHLKGSLEVRPVYHSRAGTRVRNPIGIFFLA